MTTATTLPLQKVAAPFSSKLEPSTLGSEIVRHYSLPAFDTGTGPACEPADGIKSAKQVIDRQSVLVSRLNPHISRVWFVDPEGGVRHLASTEFLCLEPADGVSAAYLYAACQTRSFTSQMARRVTGTSTSHQRVPVREVTSISVAVPKASRQEAIGRAMLALDARLAGIRKKAELLLDIVGAAFREHFSAAVSSGTKLGEEARVSGGVSYRSKDFGGAGQALVTLKCFDRHGGYRSDGLKNWDGVPRSQHRVDPGDIIVAKTDLTQAADVLGRAQVVRRSHNHRLLVASLDVAVIRPRDPQVRPFLLGALLDPAFRQYARSVATGTTVLHLPSSAIPEYRLPNADIDEMRMFSRRLQPCLDRMTGLDVEAARVRALRQAFLDQVVSW